MLETLRVKNLAIVEDVHADFGHGLNVITGETGAGKSILLAALGLLLGERADRNLVRAEADQAVVEAAFRLADSSELDLQLDALGLQACEDGMLILRRQVMASGQNRILVNGSPATVQALKQIGDLLVDMHGPHDHQSLLSRDFQMDLLDAFGHLWKTRAAYETIYQQRTDLQNRLAELDRDTTPVADQIDMLNFQIRELEQAELTDADDGDLAKEHDIVANAARIMDLAQSVQNGLVGDDPSVFNSLATIQRTLSELVRLLPDAETWIREIESTSIQIQETADSINRTVSRIEADPQRLQWLDDRMALLHRLKRKYGATVPEMLAFLEKARERRQSLESRDATLSALRQELAQCETALQSAGKTLGNQRRKIAGQLADAITGELRALGFPHGVFSVDLTTSDPQPSGLDTIEFGFAPNVGEPSRPLRAIASSGEISRVMLAVKAVLAKHDRIPVLVFDEVDANLGGEMGYQVGAKLRAVAKHHQVICITHLPQVAVHGNTHFMVGKAVRDGRTFTDIQPVEGEQRVDEIARMLGGRDRTSVTLKHAREMLANV
ncbi:MAG: DNA repair protein RecN [Lentisphaerae bacterium RIFOXYC12_FULL_60_16]|nr:MAG: DNA repair protein RecN [Lentisphaerae bacterium RIFOXYC12_FULL_60_16]OGV86975.1 MAG: DNA repair protein RecN [Lentisphaerae bacterium RIFOXYB12_FULL_60_10]